MHFFVEKIVIPLVVGIIVAVIIRFIAVIMDKPLKWNVIFAVAILATIVSIIVIINLPPYKVTDVKWCSEENDEVRITGRLLTGIFGFSVPNRVVQVKVYVAGQGDPPFKEAKVPRTDIDGTFGVKFPPPAPSSRKLYVINTAYKYDTPLRKGMWKIKDFNAGDPSACEGL